MKRWLPFLFAVLVFAGGALAVPTMLNNLVTAATFVAEATSGNPALSVTNNGARVYTGAGANTYIDSAAGVDQTAHTPFNAVPVGGGSPAQTVTVPDQDYLLCGSLQSPSALAGTNTLIHTTLTRAHAAVEITADVTVQGAAAVADGGIWRLTTVNVADGGVPCGLTNDVGWDWPSTVPRTITCSGNIGPGVVNLDWALGGTSGTVPPGFTACLHFQ